MSKRRNKNPSLIKDCINGKKMVSQPATRKTTFSIWNQNDEKFMENAGKSEQTRLRPECVTNSLKSHK